MHKELELTDEQLETICGGLCVHPVGLGLGGGFGLDGGLFGLGGGSGYGSSGFSGGPVFVAQQPQVVLVPVQGQPTMVDPVPVTGVQTATACQQQVALALV